MPACSRRHDQVAHRQPRRQRAKRAAADLEDAGAQLLEQPERRLHLAVLQQVPQMLALARRAGAAGAGLLRAINERRSMRSFTKRRRCRDGSRPAMGGTPHLQQALPAQVLEDEVVEMQEIDLHGILSRTGLDPRPGSVTPASSPPSITQQHAGWRSSPREACAAIKLEAAADASSGAGVSAATGSNKEPGQNEGTARCCCGAATTGRA